MALSDLVRFGGGGEIDLANQQQLLLDIANPPEDWIPKTSNIPTYEQWLASKGPDYVDPATGIVRGTTDNSAAYEYANQFYQLPVNSGDWLTYAPLVAGAAIGGVAAAGVGGAAAGAAEAGTAGSLADAALVSGAADDLYLSGLAGESVVGGTAPVAGEFSLAGGPTGYGVSGTSPVTTGGMGGGSTGLMQGASGTPLSRLLGLGQTGSDALSVLGTIGATGLGVYGANKESDALTDIANQSRADRALFLEASKKYLADPASYFEGPGRGALDAILAALSAKFGNPIGSGTALQIATGAGLQNWQNAVTGFGNLGLSGEDTRSQLLASAAGKDADVFTNIAGGAADLIRPRRTLADLAREYRAAGLI